MELSIENFLSWIEGEFSSPEEIFTIAGDNFAMVCCEGFGSFLNPKREILLIDLLVWALPFLILGICQLQALRGLEPLSVIFFMNFGLLMVEIWLGTCYCRGWLWKSFSLNLLCRSNFLILPFRCLFFLGCCRCWREWWTWHWRLQRGWNFLGSRCRWYFLGGINFAGGSFGCYTLSRGRGT